MKPSILHIGTSAIVAYHIEPVTFTGPHSAPTLPRQQDGDYLVPEDDALLVDTSAGDILFSTSNGDHYLLNSKDKEFKSYLDAINAAKGFAILGAFNTSYLQRQLNPFYEVDAKKTAEDEQKKIAEQQTAIAAQQKEAEEAAVAAAAATAAAEAATKEKAAQDQAAKREKSLESEKKRMITAGAKWLDGRAKQLTEELADNTKVLAKEAIEEKQIELEAITFELQRREGISKGKKKDAEAGKGMGGGGSSSSESHADQPHPDLELASIVIDETLSLPGYTIKGNAVAELEMHTLSDQANPASAYADLVFTQGGQYVLLPSDYLASQEAFQSLIAHAEKAKQPKPFYIHKTLREQAKYKTNEAGRIRMFNAMAAEKKAMQTQPDKTAGKKANESTALNPNGTSQAFQPKNWIAAGSVGATVAGMGSIVHMPPTHAAIHFHPGTAWGLGLTLIPASAALVAGGVNYLLQCAKIMATEKRKPTEKEYAAIKKQSVTEAGKLGGAVFAAEFFNRIVRQMVDGGQLDKVLGNATVGRGGFDVTFNGAAMLMTGLGVGLGLCAAIYLQNKWATRQDPETPPVNASTYLASLAVGFAIGAAAAIGYSREVANFFMPFISTTALLLAAPKVESGFSGAGTAITNAATAATKRFSPAPAFTDRSEEGKFQKLETDPKPGCFEVLKTRFGCGTK